MADQRKQFYSVKLTFKYFLNYEVYICKQPKECQLPDIQLKYKIQKWQNFGLRQFYVLKLLNAVPNTLTEKSMLTF